MKLQSFGALLQAYHHIAGVNKGGARYGDTIMTIVISIAFLTWAPPADLARSWLVYFCTLPFWHSIPGIFTREH
jgi:hypothetical protein